jgi:agmatinase
MTTPLFDPNGPALEGSGIFGLPYTPAEARVVLLPVPWEPTTSYRRGTAGGPRAILEASRQVDLFDVELGKPYEAGIAMLEESREVREWNRRASAAAEPVIASGGVVDGKPELQASLETVNDLGAKLNAWVSAETERWTGRDKLVGLVGGDHSTPFGAIQAVARRHPGLGILHFDAHADLRDAYEGFVWSHASIMHNVMTRIPEVARLVQVGIRDLGEAEHEFIRASGGRIVTHFDAEMAAARFEGETWAARSARIVDALPKDVYVSFDIDGLDPAFCPNTGTPVPGGLTLAQATYLIGAVVKSSRRIVGFDLNEVAPGPESEWDGNVGARLLYKMIGWALRSQR